MSLNVNNYEIQSRDARMYSQTSIVRAGLVLHLDASIYNNVSYGTTWFDLSGNGNNGTLINGPTFNSDSGGTIVFNGTNYVSTTGMANFSYTSGITVETWIFNTGGDYRGVVNNGTSGDRIGGFDLRFGRENFFGGTNNGTNLNWRITNSAGTGTGITINAELNVWGHYVGTYNNTHVAVYKNGQLFDSINHSGGGQLKTVNESTTIGWSRDTVEYLANDTSNMRLAIAKIYNRALSAAEITHNYNVTRGRFGL